MPLAALLVLLAQLDEGRLATVEGGSLAFSLAIARRYVELGGQIVYGAPVREVLVEGAGHGRDRAVGVRLEGGAEHRADVVISAADGRSTHLRMLGGRTVDRATREQYETWPRSPAIVMASYGVRRTLPDLPAVNVIRLDRPLLVAGVPVEHLTCRVRRGPPFAPQGAAVVQATLPSDYAYWHDLWQADADGYEAAKEGVAERVLERLEGLLPGIGDAVEMRDVATPHTWQRYTGNDRGALTGWLLTPERLGRTPSRTVPGLENFYMAGQWVVPGGGVPQVLLSGRQAVQRICQGDQRLFVIEGR
jgi:phytoene dehydrogenase-like protein